MDNQEKSSPKKGFTYRKTLFPFILFIIFGAGFCLIGMVPMMEAKASMNWPTTEGVVNSSSMAEGEDSFTEDTVYIVNVNYTFTVDGKEYTGSEVSAGSDQGYATENYAELVLSRYPRGQEVAVYYYPKNPAKAFLEPGDSNGSVVIFAGGMIFLIIGISGYAFCKSKIRAGYE